MRLKDKVALGVHGLYQLFIESVFNKFHSKYIFEIASSQGG